MKNLYLILFICCLFFQHLPAQSFFSAGTNYSVLSYEPGFSFFGKQKLENFKLTPSVGYGYRLQLNDKWAFLPAIHLSDLGWFNGPRDSRTIHAVYAISLNHSVHYKPLSWFSLGLSPTLNYNVFAGVGGKVLVADNKGIRFFDEKLIGWKKTSPSSKLNRLVFTLIPTVTFHLNERWSIDLFYRNDLTSVGYPARLLNYTLRGYGTGVNLRCQLQHKKQLDSSVE